MHGFVPENPARGKAQGRMRSVAKGKPRKRTENGSEAQKSTPIWSEADRLFRSLFPNRRPVTPTKINRGGQEARTARGPGQAEMPLIV